jgi:NitT/TauT family transport system substrate-binding protein
MPAIVGTSKRNTRDLRIVATLGLGQDQCGVFLTRPDAPQFASQQAAIGWFDGKTVATPQGSCTDRIAQATFDQFHVQPGAYLNQSIDVITSSFQSHKIDAAVVWEPTASKLINAGLARRVTSGILANQHDGAFMLMDKELLDKHPKIAESWLKAELDAQRFLADPANADQIIQMAKSQTEGFSPTDLRDALYRNWPPDLGGSTDGTRLHLPYVPTGDSATLIETATAFLYRIKAIPAVTLPDGAVQPDIAANVLGAARLNTAQGAGLVAAR